MILRMAAMRLRVVSGTKVFCAVFGCLAHQAVIICALLRRPAWMLMKKRSNIGRVLHGGPGCERVRLAIDERFS